MSRLSEKLQRSVDAMNRGDAAGYATEYADDATLIDPTHPEPQVGRAAIEADMAAFVRAFPDVHGTLTTVIEQDDLAAAIVEITGTHQGPLETADGNLAPTGRSLTFQTCDVVRVGEDGRYVENRRYYDLANVLAQVGLTLDGKPQLHLGGRLSSITFDPAGESE